MALIDIDDDAGSLPGDAPKFAFNARPLRWRRLRPEDIMTKRQAIPRGRHVRRPDAGPPGEPAGAPADQRDVPDGPGAATPVETAAPQRDDEVSIDAEGSDRPESGSIEAVEHDEAADGILAPVESKSAADEGEVSEGDPWH
jgi:hypothetical protein